MHKEEIVNMVNKVKKRESVLERLSQKRLTQRQAAELLNLSTRQIRNIHAKFKRYGTNALLNARLGKSSNRRFSNAFKQQVLNLIKEHYHDYGPTLAAEKLQEYNDISVSRETLRKWMIEAHIWRHKTHSPIRVHQPRYRRPCLGELVQIDGSIHDWFEGRAPKCTLLVFIDDATSKLQKLLFVNAETTFNYFKILKAYLREHGKPKTLYSDKHGVFKTKIESQQHGCGLTQFGRVLRQLHIELIYAHSPQAKGRIERANGILQDRLIKALRYHNISDMETANAFLENTFIHEYNQKFAKPPHSPQNLHIPLSDLENKYLDHMCTLQVPRKVSKQLTVRHKNIIYKIKKPTQARTLRRVGVTLCEDESGKITLYYKGNALEYEVYNENMHAGQVVDRKNLESYLNEQMLKWRPANTPQGPKPQPHHPH